MRHMEKKKQTKKQEKKPRQKALPYLQAIPEILRFQLATKTVIYVVLALLNCAFLWLLRSTGRVALVADDLLWLFLSPQGLILSFLTLVFVCSCAVVDLYTKIIFSYYWLHNKLLTWKKFCVELGRVLRKFCNWRGFLVLFYLLVIGPLVSFDLKISLTQRFYMPTFISSVIEDNTVYSLSYSILTWAFFIIGYIHIFAFPALLVDDLDLKTALARSRKLMKRFWWRFLLSSTWFSIKYVLCSAGVVLAGLIVPFATWMIFADSAFADSLQLLTCLLLLVYVAFAFLLSFPFYIMYLVQMYVQYSTGEVTLYLPHRKKLHPWFWTACTLAIVTCVGCALVLEIAEIEVEPVATLVVAHRGGGGEKLENTLTALQHSIDLGIDGVEFDVQRTKDGHYIVNHDITFSRLAGEKRQPMEMTLDEIKLLRLRDPRDHESSGEPVATYEEFLDLAKDQIMLFVELKGASADQQMADDLIAIARERDMLDQIAFTSLNYNVISYIETKYPEIVTVFVTSFGFGKLAEIPCDYLALEEEMSRSEIVKNNVQAQGKKLVVWSPNTRSTIEHFYLQNSDVIYTDYPSLARDVRVEMNERTDTEALVDEIMDFMDEVI